MPPRPLPISRFLTSAFRAAALGCLFFAVESHAAVTVRFSQRGNDVVVTSTGSLNLTGLEWAWSAWELEDGAYRQIGGNLPQDLIRMYRTSVSSFEFPIGGDLFSNLIPFRIADEFSGTTFGLWANASMTALYVPRHFKSGPIESSVTFRDLDLASLGVIEQVIKLGATEDLQLTITAVPEVATLTLSALALAALTCIRRRQEPGPTQPI